MTYSNFDIATDVRVWLYLPAGNDVFTWSLSKWSSGDKWADGTVSSFDWTPIQATVADLRITSGMSTDQGAIFQIEPGTLDLTLQSDDYDPNANNAIRVGTRIKITIPNSSEVDSPIFFGKIQDINVSYVPDGPNTITVVAGDLVTDLMEFKSNAINQPANTEVDTYATAIELAAQAGIDIFVVSDFYGGITMQSYNQDDFITGELVNECLVAELGMLVREPEAEDYLIYRTRSYVDSIGDGQPADYYFDNDHSAVGHLCFTDIQVQNTGVGMANSITGFLKKDAAITYSKTNTDSTDVYGFKPLEYTANLWNVTMLQNWVETLLGRTPTKRISLITGSPINPDNSMNDLAFVYPSQIVRTKFTRPSFSADETSLITKIEHIINPDGWSTTLDLWKPTT